LKHLYSEKVIPHLHSCLDEIVWTSILRYEELGVVEINSYGNKQGSKTNFVMCNSDMQPKLQQTLDLLQGLRPMSSQQTLVINEEIANSIMRAQGPLPLAKL